MPVFSIITVTFNAEKTIERTINSVLQQTYADIEYLIIDGASTDGTIGIVTNYELRITNKVRKFECVSEPDKGIYDAMNKGLQRATGDYVWFLNAGDIFKSNETVAKLAEIAKTNNLPDILYGETDLMDAAGNVFAERRLKAPQNLNWKSFRMGMLVCHQAFVVKRNIAPEYDLNYRYSADFDWCIRCMKGAEEKGEREEEKGEREKERGEREKVKGKNIVNSNLRLVNYQYEGTTTVNRKASLKERYHIMCHYYGTIPTMLRHLWFAARYYFAKIFRNNS